MFSTVMISAAVVFSLMPFVISGCGIDDRKSGMWSAAAAATTAARAVCRFTPSVPASAAAVDVFVVAVANTERADGASTGRDGRRHAAAPCAAASRRHGDPVSAAGRLVRPWRFSVDGRRDRWRHGGQSGRAAAPGRPWPTRRSQARSSDSVGAPAIRSAASQRPGLISAMIIPLWCFYISRVAIWTQSVCCSFLLTL